MTRPPAEALETRSGDERLVAGEREAPTREKAYIPSLDGLRAISIGLVVAWHVAGFTEVFPLDQMWRFDGGNLGVRVFFVISGFLITSLLLGEHGRSGRIDLPRFYFRRTFRLMPALYAFLLAMWAADALGWQNVPASAIAHAATYTGNYLSTAWPVGHTWSLAVEEQFYLIWPGLLALGGLVFGFRGALLVLFVSPVLRAAALGLGHWPDNPRYSFECVADALATGCLLARHRSALWAWTPYRSLLESRLSTVWPLLPFLTMVLAVRFPLAGAAVFLSLTNLSIALGIDWSLRNATAPLGRLLNAPPLIWVGRLSYSIYLWQQPFLAEDRHLPLPAAIAALSACAVASFYLIETPALALRSRIEHRIFDRKRR